MAKLEGVKVVDMTDGQPTKVTYNGEDYVKVGVTKRRELLLGDVVMSKDGISGTTKGQYYEVVTKDCYGDLAIEDDINEIRSALYDGMFELYRKQSVLNTLNYEGVTYKKVDRDAKVGDYVVFTDEYVIPVDTTVGKPYEITGIDEDSAYGWYDDEEDFRETHSDSYPNKLYEKVSVDESDAPAEDELKVGDYAEVVKISSAMGGFVVGGVVKVANTTAGMYVFELKPITEMNAYIGYGDDEHLRKIQVTMHEGVPYREVERRAKVGDLVEYENGLKKLVTRVDKYGDLYGASQIGSGDGWKIYGIESPTKVYEPLNTDKKESQHIADYKRPTTGDLVKVVNMSGGYHSYRIGDVVKIVEDAKDRQPYKAERPDGTIGDWLFEKEVELVSDESKFPGAPSETITFEGAEYRLVDRKAQAGDVVYVTKEAKYTPGVPNDNTHLVDEDGKIGNNSVWRHPVYRDCHNRTESTVKVYEKVADKFAKGDTVQVISDAAHVRTKKGDKGLIEDIGDASLGVRMDCGRYRAIKKIHVRKIMDAKPTQTNSVTITFADGTTDTLENVKSIELDA